MTTFNADQFVAEAAAILPSLDVKYVDTSCPGIVELVVTTYNSYGEPPKVGDAMDVLAAKYGLTAPKWEYWEKSMATYKFDVL